MKNEMKPNVVGIDIGGTNTVFGIVDQKGTVLASNSIKTQAYPELENYMSTLCEGIAKLVADTCGMDKIQGIGVGAPNANFYTGNIEHAANLPWKGIIPFAKMMSEKLGVPVALTNDANAAAIGEMKYGVAKGMKDFIMITLGTGVGSGVVANGQLIYGHDGFAGELGHVIVERNGRPCGCGNKGCLETYTSATGVARTAREFLEKRANEDSLLRKIPADQITSKDVFDAAKAGDAIAKDIFAFTGEVLGSALADFIKFSSPEAIVLFGGLAKSGDLLLVPLKKAMEDNLMPIFKNKVKVLFSGMKDADAAVLGASALGWDAK
ncbi:MAG: ROK family protein [Paludibacteraceae bacterium]|nr:ROK family protein [Paludibacteraceae bacterium]